MLQIQLQIILYVIIGYVITKLGMITLQTRQQLANIVINVLLASNIFIAFDMDATPQLLRECALVFVVSVGIHVFYVFLMYVLYRKKPADRRAILRFGILANNSGFLGLPVVNAVFGPTGVLYASISLIPARIFTYTVGIAQFVKTDFKGLVKELVTNPCIIAVVLGFIYMFSGIKLPPFIYNTIDGLNGCLTPFSMMVVGSVLCDVDLRTVLEFDCFGYTFLRLILIPAAVWGILRLCGIGGLAMGVNVLETAMPAAAVSTMMAQRYDTAPGFAAKLLCVSTIISFITLPLWSEILIKFT